MKKLTMLAAALSFLSLPVFAAQQPECDHSGGAIHCSFFEGASAKIVRITPTIISGQTQSQIKPVTFCLNHYGLVVDRSFIDAGIAKVGDTFKLEYNQCSNKRCTQTVPLATETFVVEQAQDGYSSTPPTFTTKLNDQYGVSCGDARSSMSRQKLHISN